MPHQNWFLVVYKVPSEPASRRVALWRRLKAAGAVYIQGGVCVLPQSDENLRLVRAVEVQIRQMGGESLLMDTVPLSHEHRDKIVARFNVERDEQYNEFIGRCDDFDAEIEKEIAANKFTYAELEENDLDLKKLLAWFDRIRKLDVHSASRAGEAGRRLTLCKQLFRSYAHMVYEAKKDEQSSGEPWIDAP